MGDEDNGTTNSRPFPIYLPTEADVSRIEHVGI